MVGEPAVLLELLQRAHDGQEPVEADAFERADLLAQRLAARVFEREHRAAFVFEDLLERDHIRVLDSLQHLGFAAQAVVDLMHIEEVDAHAVVAEEDRFGRCFVGADAFGFARGRDLEEARDIAAASGHIANLQRDLVARFVFSEVHEREPATSEELDHGVGADALASFQLDHGVRPVVSSSRDRHGGTVGVQPCHGLVSALATV